MASESLMLEVILFSMISGKWKALLKMRGFTFYYPGVVYCSFAGEKPAYRQAGRQQQRRKSYEFHPISCHTIVQFS
jgi:hypothetical protein